MSTPRATSLRMRLTLIILLPLLIGGLATHDMALLATALIACGIMFELPIIIFLLAQMGVVTPGFLIRKFRWAVLLIFIAAAFVTPTPDVVNLLMFALPTIVLYLLGVGAAALVLRGKKKEEKKAGQSEDQAP